MSRGITSLRQCMIVSSLLGVVSSLLPCACLHAGPLNPPAGPITSTNKPLSEVEPRIAINATNTPGDANSLFKITQPGSYYLTGNITGVTNKHGIEIAASGVTIDLNGFDLQSEVGSGTLDAIVATVPDLDNITIHNGSIRNWGGDGIDLDSSASQATTITNVRATNNGGRGIAAFTSASISGCTASSNTGVGIIAGWGSTITSCTAYGNTAGGMNIGIDSTIAQCTVTTNQSTGIVTSDGCTITATTASFNAGSGISSGNRCTISNCTTRRNALDGIRAGSQSSIIANTSSFNSGDGVRAIAQCTILNNTSASNGDSGSGAGVHVTGADNRIEGNSCTGADRGIDVDVAGNIIIRNTCSGNTTNWDIVIGNSVGAIVVAGTNAVAINGNGAVASTLGSTDPNANFSY